MVVGTNRAVARVEVSLRDDYLLSNAGLWVHEYFDVFDVSVEHVEVVWNRRFTRTIATAQLDEAGVRIAISSHLYPSLVSARRIEVVAHEVCHIAAWLEHGTEIEDHGPEWAQLMRSLGYSPLDCMQI